jgi:hypothetical protein
VDKERTATSRVSSEGVELLDGVARLRKQCLCFPTRGHLSHIWASQHTLHPMSTVRLSLPLKKCLGEKDVIPRVPDGVQKVPDVSPPQSIVVLTPKQLPVEPTAALVRQPSFHGARPRRSCLRRQSTATTVCSAGSGSAAREGGLSDELKLTPCEGGETQECAAVAPIVRSVSFLEKASVQEYGMILGDHPCVDRGYVMLESFPFGLCLEFVILHVKTFLVFLSLALP